MCLVIEEPVQELSIEWVTARKAHRCTECRRTIDPGEYRDRDREGGTAAQCGTHSGRRAA